MQVSGATAVITGGAGGLGAATARRLHREGANVVLADVKAEQGQALAQELGQRAEFVNADVTSSEQLQTAMDLAATKFGGVHVLVNCAGIFLGERTLTRAGPHDMDRFKKVIAVNLTGTFDASRLAAVKMTQNEPNEWGERGVIVNVASIAGLEGSIGVAAYGASKAGVIGMTIVAARDLAGLGIRVCTIAPGFFDTQMFVTLPEEVKASQLKAVPFPPRMGQPDEFAMLVEHIVQNPMLNGETIRIDGAARMPAR